MTYKKYISHTVSTFVIMIRDLLSNGVLDYVLTGKFQTDQLESRFVHYRQLLGSNYLVSAADILQSEKKLKVKRLLRLYTASKGTVSIKNYLIIVLYKPGLGSSTVDQVLKYIKYPKYIPSTSTGQVLIFLKST